MARTAGVARRDGAEWILSFPPPMPSRRFQEERMIEGLDVDEQKKYKRELLDDGQRASCKRQKREPETSEPEEDDDLGEPICAICDDGGDLLCCEGPCLRSFHGYKQRGTACHSLGLSEAEVKNIAKFFCKNCAANEHQCFACGNLGRSQGPSQEVFLCDIALCARFYHPQCVSKLLGGKNVDNGFTCPLHSCFKCHRPENAEESLWLYPCRRCPRAWHEKCAGVSFEEDDVNRRGWEVGNAKFLYCMKHRVDPLYNTPKRDHLKFPVPRIETSLPKRQSFKQLNKNAINVRSPTFSLEDVEVPVSEIMRSCKIPFESISRQLIAPSTVRRFSNKNCQLNRISSLMNAFFKASYYLKRGASAEAKLLFSRNDLHLLENAKVSLRVYLAPLLYGMRYSSYGRHFTRTDKLEEVVNRLSAYVSSGDMVVDLCCGANEFSRLMANKLAAMNKVCSFKNFDFIQPSDTFHFQRKDYMTITKDDLCESYKLIMGLNPPFGVNGQLASKFLEHCATFKPKIIILIAPEETRRLSSDYVLTWFDRELLRGDAFYLPGSVDTKGNTVKQENRNPPILYFYSRADYAEAHQDIAAKNGHLGEYRWR